MAIESEISRLIKQTASGDIACSDGLLSLVYDELRALARGQLARERSESLQTTELVHEAYMRMVGPNQHWENRAHFFGAAAEAMRRVLVDRARRRNRKKRVPDREKVELHESAVFGECPPEEVVVVGELFDLLAEKHPAVAVVAKLRYFLGFNNRETSEALGVPLSTVHTHWTFAKAWLYRECCKSD